MLLSDKLFICIYTYKIAKNYSYVDVVLYSVKELLLLFIKIDRVI